MKIECKVSTHTGRCSTPCAYKTKPQIWVGSASCQECKHCVGFHQVDGWVDCSFKKVILKGKK